MTQAMQIHFRRLLPDESLVEIVAARCRHMREVLQMPLECVVSLEAQSPGARSFVRAVVQLLNEGRVVAEAAMRHKSSRGALTLAFAQITMQLGVMDLGLVLDLPQRLSA